MDEGISQVTSQGRPFGLRLWIKLLNGADKAPLPPLALPSLSLFPPTTLPSIAAPSFLPQDVCVGPSLCLESCFLGQSVFKSPLE